MPKTELRDLVVFLPGIGGSVLQGADGKDLWAPSIGAVWRGLTRPSETFAKLRLDGDDPEREVLDDGIRAVRVVPDIHLLPGLWKIDGYGGFTRMMTEAFEIETGSAAEDDGRVANYLEFPYDWRRDNRAAAHRLRRLIDDRLHRWRKNTPFGNARVVLIAHSMGGLVARYYLEVLGGWQDCRALITLGTPYRGSVKAVDVLANGFRKPFAGLTEVARSLTSVYQLLPRYRMLEVDARFQRVSETDGIPGIARDRAQEALEFHEEIDDAVAARKERGYELVPIVGTWQPTLQSARLVQGRVTVDTAPPGWTTFPAGEGDGTVPRVSAVPIEMSDAWLNTFVAERHSSLQNHDGILQDLLDRLIQSQVATSHIRGAAATGGQKAALAIDLEDVYLSGQPVVVNATIRNGEPGDIRSVRARLESTTRDAAALDLDFAAAGTGWRLQAAALPAGAYRIEVSASGTGTPVPDPVHDVFVVENP